MNIKEKMKKNKIIEMKIIEILKENNVTLRDFDTISDSIKMKFVETATLKNEVPETANKNEIRVDVKLNTEEIEKVADEVIKKHNKTQQPDVLGKKMNKIINLLEGQLKIQSCVLASRGVDVLKLLDKDLVELCAETLERWNQRPPYFRKTL